MLNLYRNQHDQTGSKDDPQGMERDTMLPSVMGEVDDQVGNYAPNLEGQGIHTRGG